MTSHAAPDRSTARGRTGRAVAVMAEGGWQLWAAVSAGVWLWAFHILFISAFARLACSDRYLTWLFHVATAATAAATALAAWVCLLMVRHCGGDEAAGTVAGRTRFLGIFGLLSNAISFGLILLEGVFVFFVDDCV